MDGKELQGLTDSATNSIVSQMKVNAEGNQYNASVLASFYPADDPNPSDVKWLYWNGPGGLYFLGGLSRYDTLVAKIMYLRYPVAPGDSWIAPHLVFDLYQNEFLIADSIRYDCVAANQPLEVPYGSFHCYVYHYRVKPEPDVLEEWDYYLYYAPKVGPVGTIITSSIDTTTKYKVLLYQYAAN